MHTKKYHRCFDASAEFAEERRIVNRRNLAGMKTSLFLFFVASFIHRSIGFVDGENKDVMRDFKVSCVDSGLCISCSKNEMVCPIYLYTLTYLLSHQEVNAVFRLKVYYQHHYVNVIERFDFMTVSGLLQRNGEEDENYMLRQERRERN